jgi:DNA-binding NarL/FixJ family response regulator
MDGFEMVREIKSINATARYIMLTARNDKDTINKFEEIGFCARLLKPLNFIDFFRAIEMCSGGRLLATR